MKNSWSRRVNSELATFSCWLLEDTDFDSTKTRSFSKSSKARIQESTKRNVSDDYGERPALRSAQSSLTHTCGHESLSSHLRIIRGNSSRPRYVRYSIKAIQTSNTSLSMVARPTTPSI